MKFLFIGFLWVITLSLNGQTTHLKNGQWFDGQRFSLVDRYIVDGALASSTSQQVDTIIDLAHQFILPPFGEGHNHGLEQAYGLEEKIRNLLSQGIFYYKNPNSLPILSHPIKSKFNSPTSIDIVYANGGLTGTDGHPKVLYDYLWETSLKYSFPGEDSSVLEQQAFWFIDSEDDFNMLWPKIKKQQPDFVKLYLLNSEKYQQWKNDTTYAGQKGLDPELLPHMISTIHKAGLRVSAHLETANDFEEAVRNGVDELNHLPGYSFNKHGHSQDLDEEIIRMAVAKNISMVPTYSVMNTFLRFSGDTAAYHRTREIQVSNLRKLKEHGVKLALGCDNYFETSLTELFYIHEFDVFDNAALLRMITENTAATIFPDRLIGRLDDGYEASFIVLKENPIENLEAIKEISLLIKDGKVLKLR